MLLAIDIGNTSTVVAYVKNQKIIKKEIYATIPLATEDDYAYKIKVGFSQYLEDIKEIIISSVVPIMDKMMKRLFEKHFEITPMMVAPGIKSGIFLKIEHPKQLGADLLCGAVGARKLTNHNLVVIDLGTATKFTVVTSKNELLGVIIAPGIIGSLQSLIASAANLTDIALEPPKMLIGRDTISSINSGSIYGTCAMIEGIVSRLIEEVGPLYLVLTGGNAIYIKDQLRIDFDYQPDLIINGLMVLNERNRK